jgi:hypothetical protein
MLQGMSAAPKLAGFAAVLAVVFGGAALAGSAVGPVHEQRSAGGMTGMAPQAVRGLAVSEGGLTLELARSAATPGKRFNLAFRIVDLRGQTVRYLHTAAFTQEVSR